MIRTIPRSLIRPPRFTLLAVLPPALTIGATTALFSRQARAGADASLPPRR